MFTTYLICIQRAEVVHILILCISFCLLLQVAFLQLLLHSLLRWGKRGLHLLELKVYGLRFLSKVLQRGLHPNTDGMVGQERSDQMDGYWNIMMTRYITDNINWLNYQEY